MKYLVAVSGGVDSVVLLDMLTKTDHHLIVAHVDHGIRGEESAADARFVAALAQRYGLSFVSTELHLGKHAGEEHARTLRYEFLFAQAEKFGAGVVTAHHRDDLVETVALNLERGTGWRGLTVLSRPGIHRPLLELSKATLYRYALAQRLEWVEDSTNNTDAYQRNRLRRRLATLDVSSAEEVAKLRARQLQLRRAIDREADRLLTRHDGSRHFLAQLDDVAAGELLAAAIARATGVRPARPQISRALLAVKTARVGTTYEVGDGVMLKFTARKYSINTV